MSQDEFAALQKRVEQCKLHSEYGNHYTRSAAVIADIRDECRNAGDGDGAAPTGGMDTQAKTPPAEGVPAPSRRYALSRHYNKRVIGCIPGVRYDDTVGWPRS